MPRESGGKGLGAAAFGGDLGTKRGLLGVALGVDLGLGFRTLLERETYGFRHRHVLGFRELGLLERAGFGDFRRRRRCGGHDGRITRSVHVEPQATKAEDQAQRPRGDEPADQAASDQGAHEVHAQPPRRCLMR